MTSKNLLLILTVLIFVSSVYATDVGYVVKTTANSNVISSIEEMGYSYDVITESQIPTTNFSNYAVLVIQDNVGNKNYLPISSKNILFLNKDLVSSIWTGGTFVSGSSNTFSAKLDELGTPFTKGFSSATFDAYTTSKPIYYLHVYPSYITSVSKTTGSTGSNSIVAYSNEAGLRKLFFGFYSFDYWSADSKKLFKNSLNWTRMGTDFDSDGYFSDYDCNDSDSTKWQYLPGYRDFDNDTLGALTLEQVCSGEALPEGYVTVSGDCDDTDPELYQTFKGYLDSDNDSYGAGEMQDVCSGETLHEGYVTRNGDCDDSDSNAWRYLQGYTDYDFDTYGTGSVENVCSGENLPAGYSERGGDCDDSDDTIWRNLPGYVDSDNDGLGVGSIVQVCSGGNLPIGYSISSGDCNDTDSTVWQFLPGYLDSDNDTYGTGNVLQVCSGENLLIGYSTRNGDCNDSDGEVFRYINGYLDSDNDGRGAGAILSVCSGENLSLGYSNTGMDCNDSNSSVWRIVIGYLDSDSDNYGIGNQLEVCSGFDLLEGYSENAGDCDDSNPAINPGSIEIPYDGIDQTCTGYDKVDLDNDGYCKLGYLITNASLQCPKETGVLGTDCNDDDINENPGSTDLSLNCVNDKPIISTISDISVHETEDVLIVINATDPENDSLNYSIDDSRFTQNDNEFLWTTTYSDLGEYTFNVTVSDGDLSSNIPVNVKVLRTNRVPVCDSLPEISLSEDSITEIDMNDYCSDLDLDNLTYEVSSVSTSSINVTQKENGIFEIVPEGNFSSDENFRISVSDGIDTIETENISLTISPVNDAPTLKEDISPVSLNQDSSLVDGLDLNNYFSDIDSNLSYTVSGNSNITIEINDGKASFYPAEGFVGTEKVIFSATDGEFSISSSPVSIIVQDVNDAPEFLELNCTTNITEDTMYSCKLLAKDIENDSVTFGVVENNNLNCSVFGDTLSYISDPDYSGDSSCTLRVTDSRGAYSDIVFSTGISNVNDGPKITDYYPKENPKLLSNVSKKFILFSSDPDSSLNITWKIGSTIVGSGSSYNFVKPKGVYDLTATVSDGEYTVTHSWNVIVGNMIDFKCSEVSGHICNENQTCTGEILGVSDSSSCCSKVCKQNPPKFTGIEKLSEDGRTDDIEIDITDPTTSEKLYIREDNNVSVKVENNKGEDMEFSVEMYIYDITKDKVIKKSRQQNLDIDDDSSKELEFTFNLPEETDEDHEYYIFIRASGRDEKKIKYYNELYQKVNIERKEIDVMIEDLEIDPTEAVCGDNITAKVSLKNYGNRYQYINAKINSEDLDISDASDSLRIEEYGDSDDEISNTFSLQIPEDAEEGTYVIKASVTGSDDTLEKEITLGKCARQVSEIKKLDTIKIGQNTNSINISSTKKENNSFLLIIGIISTILIVGILGMIYVYFKNVNNSDITYDDTVTSFDMPKEDISPAKKSGAKKKRN